METSAYIEFFIRAFAGVFVILDPLGACTHFLALTSHQTDDMKRNLAKRASLVSLFVLIFFTVAGGALFKYFGITLSALKIAGGILLFSIAFSMLNARRSATRTTPEEEKEHVELEDIAIIPMAIPILSGPGAITTVMVLAGEAGSAMNVGILLFVILLSVFIAYMMLTHSQFLLRVLRQTGTKILTRVMGLIMSVIAVQFVINGFSDVLPFILMRMDK